MDDVRDDSRRRAEAALLAAIARLLPRHHSRGNACLVGFASAFDPRPRIRRTWLSEGEGMWADWAALGGDLRDAMTEADRSRSTQ